MDYYTARCKIMEFFVNSHFQRLVSINFKA